eukprot:TRINITY_DN15130_c0_g1_i1.p2 TRINITY_DN15130_c0_g1~~TRINITY_DN15130_c0_g1_i1.p2  ORF type:complete len:356 (+),score=105.33 TRINITY_DN15130_c0_g1_i1:77-1144(+)
MGAYESKFFEKETMEDMKRRLYCDSEDDFDDTYRKWWVYANATCAEDLEKTYDDEELRKEACPNDPDVLDSRNGGPVLGIEAFLSFPCLRTNPWAPLLYRTFRDTTDGMTFRSFMLLASVMSRKAPIEVKAATAFLVFDFNHEKELQVDDILPMLEVLVGLRCLWTEAEEEWAARGARTGWTGPFPQLERHVSVEAYQDQVARGVAGAKKVHLSFARKEHVPEGLPEEDLPDVEPDLEAEPESVNLFDAADREEVSEYTDAPEVSEGAGGGATVHFAGLNAIPSHRGSRKSLGLNKSFHIRQRGLRKFIEDIADRVWAVLEASGASSRVSQVQFDRAIRRDATFREKFTMEFVRW